jgi:SpoIID/LytB domain protein
VTRARGRWPRSAVAAVALSLAAIVALGTTTSASAGTARLKAFPSQDVTFTGHGNGPGYGMGQWGAFGYAALLHWTYGRILGHFYANPSAPVSLHTLSHAQDASRLVNVGITENDDDPVTVTSSSAFTFVTPAGTTIATIRAGHAARAVETGKAGALMGRWELEKAAMCGASRWKVIATGLTDPVAVPASLLATAPSRQLLTLCRGDGLNVTYRGTIEAFDYFGAQTSGEHLERTINTVPLEQYVADVTPGESPAGWGAYGGTSASPQGEPWGFQALEAQAVAVRSYVLYVIGHGGWYGYASICDDICQYYSRGIGFESPFSNLAASDTKGVYLEQGGRSAVTEYESSSGGYTEKLSYGYPGGSTIFDAVPDAGDQVCIGGQATLGCNPWHTWTVSIPVATVEHAFGSVGTLESVKVTLKDVSRRVETIEIIGKDGTTSVSGGTFTSDFGGFSSTLFAVTNGPGATRLAGPSDVATVGRPGFRPPVGPPHWAGAAPGSR